MDIYIYHTLTEAGEGVGAEHMSRHNPHQFICITKRTVCMPMIDVVDRPTEPKRFPHHGIISPFPPSSC